MRRTWVLGWAPSPSLGPALGPAGFREEPITPAAGSAEASQPSAVSPSGNISSVQATSLPGTASHRLPGLTGSARCLLAPRG